VLIAVMPSLAVIALTLAMPMQSGALRGVRAADTAPIVPRGGVMVLQLSADRSEGLWPATLPLTMDDGRTLQGVVGWIGPVDSPRERTWTDDPRGLAIAESNTFSASGQQQGGVPYLLVRTPADAAGSLKLDRQVIRPSWVEMPPAPLFDVPLQRRAANDRPDVDSPFEQWRWSLLAHEQGMQMPPFESDSVQEEMLAEHLTALWHIGLARLDRIDAALATTLRRSLINVATDRGESFAAWVADPAATGELLGELTSQRNADDALVEYVKLWLDRHVQPMLWPEADYDTVLRLAVVNPSNERKDMSVRWPGSSETPMRVVVEPTVLMRVVCAKPRLEQSPVPELYGRQPVRGESAVVTLDGQELDLPLRARRYAVVPPGVFLSELSPPLSLAELQMRRRLPIRSDQATLVTIRKMQGRWEVFIDCRRPARMEDVAPIELPASLPSFDALRGMEAITVVVGPEQLEDGPSAIVTVPEHGWPRVYLGGQDGSMQVHRGSYSDRWFARIVLPDRWLPHTDLGPALMGFIRTHGDSLAIETGPNSSVPWRIEPGRVALDFSEWDGEASN